MAEARRTKFYHCAGGIQPVRVVHGDGQVLNLAPNVRVADVIRKHPHHYVCHVSPDQSNKSTMLPLDTELEPGSVYFLLPLPRLFPNPGNSSSPSCSCYMHERREQEGGGEQIPLIQKGGFSPLLIRQMITRIGSPLRTPKKKVSPEISRQPSSTEPSTTNPYSPNFGKENNPLLSPVYKHKRSNSSPKRSKSPKSKSSTQSGDSSHVNERETSLCTRWKPRLGCISETQPVAVADGELRLMLDRRRLTFESRGRPGSPLRNSDFSRSPSRTSSGDYSSCRSPSRELRSTRDVYTSSPRHMPLGGYLFV